jgi:hypothetical protein
MSIAEGSEARVDAGLRRSREMSRSSESDAEGGGGLRVAGVVAEGGGEEIGEPDSAGLGVGEASDRVDRPRALLQVVIPRQAEAQPPLRFQVVMASPLNATAIGGPDQLSIDSPGRGRCSRSASPARSNAASSVSRPCVKCAQPSKCSGTTARAPRIRLACAAASLVRVR